MKSIIKTILLLSTISVAAAEPVVIEKLLLQTNGPLGARIVGIISNKSNHHIVQPVLEVTFVTKEQPDRVLTERLILSASIKSGESRPFHSGGFSGPPSPDPRLDGQPQRITEIKTARLQPGSLLPPSPEWLSRLESRDKIQTKIAQVVTADQEWHEIEGIMEASADTRIRSTRITSAYFDKHGELVDVRTFTVQKRDGKCIDTFPFTFRSRVETAGTRIQRAHVSCFVDEVTFCD